MNWRKFLPFIYRRVCGSEYAYILTRQYMVDNRIRVVTDMRGELKPFDWYVRKDRLAGGFHAFTRSYIRHNFIFVESCMFCEDQYKIIKMPDRYVRRF